MTSYFAPTVRGSLFRVLLWMGGLLSSGGLASFLAFGKTVTEKYVTILVMPCGLIWLLLLGASFLAFFLRSKPAGWAGLLTFAVYTVLCSGHTSCWLVNSIEAEMREIQPLEEEPFDRVIVLGGGGSIGGNHRAQGNASGDRLILAASLYHQKVTPVLVCTGTRIKGLGDDLPGPFEVTQEVLTSLGVPKNAIERVEGRNTSEELAALAKVIGEREERVGIVTSAWHLPRALKLAEKQGLNLSPLPADFLGGPQRPMSLQEKIKACLPEVDNLNATTKILKEYLAMAVGR